MTHNSEPAPAMATDRERTPVTTSDPLISRDTFRIDAGRYQLERVLGTGSMGAVHLVRDRETGEYFALKKLFKMDAKSVLRLKREFRSLADMSHPNLVKLYELGRGEDGWFIVMEYVPGEELWSYVGLDDDASMPGAVRSSGGMMSFQARLEERILPAFSQLAEGVHALHQARKLHRDLKPSNVLVSNGRVVVLDFGLVRDLDARTASLTEEGVISGTPAYMAPEQALGKPLSAASDWYAFGGMFYEALTTQLPFEGAVLALLKAKLDHDPTPPTLLSPSIPRPMSDLCMALLARRPEDRPDGAEIVSRLSQWTTVDRMPHSVVPLSTDIETQGALASTFVGRPELLAELDEAMLSALEQNAAVVVHLRGTAGSGKSALLEHFLDGLEQRMAWLTYKLPPLILRSRCYEREAMPFKALDGVVDALAHDLARMDEFEVSHLLPTDVEILAQLFPALQRLSAVLRLLPSKSPEGEAVRNRRRAEQALRELFCRLAARRPVVVWIDDLQWGDMDSAGILKSWVDDATDLPLLLLFSYRSDEADTSECLKLLTQPSPEAHASATTMIDLAPLSDDEVRRLVECRLGPHEGDRSELVEHVVREAQGSPFLAGQLAALAVEKLKLGTVETESLSIGQMVAETGGLLPQEAQRLLSVLAVAGRPMEPRIASEAAGIERGGRETVHALQRLQLVRTRNVGGQRLLEIYHNRVRHGVLENMSPHDIRKYHATLLDSLENNGGADPEWLHMLAMSAEDTPASLRYGLRAADRAKATLAFERAAELYSRCLEIMGPEADERYEVCLKLGEVLAYCGRGAQAADACMEASKLVEGPQAIRLTHLSTSHLLRSGRFVEGEEMLQRVFDLLGISVPKTAVGLKAAIAWERARLAVRGMEFTPRPEAEIPTEMLERIDVFNDLRVDVGSIDPLRGGLFLSKLLRWALDAGEPLRFLKALFGVGYLQASIGSATGQRKADALLEQMDGLASLIDTEEARMYAVGAHALVCWTLGRFEEVLGSARELEALYEKLAGSGLDSYYHYFRQGVMAAFIGTLFELSEYEEATEHLQAIVGECERTDNRAGLLQLSLSRIRADEFAGRPEAAVERLMQEREQLPPIGFGTYHALHMISVCHAAAITGQYAWGLELLDTDWPLYMRSPVHRMCAVGFLAQGARAQLLFNHHLAQGSTGGAAARPPSFLSKEVQALRNLYPRERAGPLALLFEARLAVANGQREHAIRLLERAIEHADREGARERARFALGLVRGGAAGESERRTAEAFFANRGVADPVAFLRGHMPELLGEVTGAGPAP